jgi:hypothetical protein
MASPNPDPETDLLTIASQESLLHQELGESDGEAEA